jgi:Carboxypeptidase regulatory-like domain
MYVCLAVLCLLASLQSPSAVRGRVVDAQTGEPLTKATVVIGGREATTDAAGAFAIGGLASGPVEVYVTTVGYGVVVKAMRLQPGDNDLRDVALHQESTAVTEHVVVAASDTPPGTGGAPVRTLNKTEIQALSMVVVGDPLRAAHSLPGVVANDDLRSDFAVRGAGFDRLGVYVDGVRTEGFIHALSESGTTDAVTLAVINQDTVGGVALFSGGFPAPFGGSNGAVLDLQTRDGNRVRNSARLSTGFVTTAGVFDGPLAHGRGSWLVAARTTRFDYLQRAVERVTSTGEKDDGSQLDFDDLQGKAVYDLSSRHQLGVSVVAGEFSQHEGDEDRATSASEPNAVDRSASHNALVTGFWRYTPAERTFAVARIFGIASSVTARNTAGIELDDSRRGEIGGRLDGGYLATPQHFVEAGAYVHSVSGRSRSLFFPAGSPDPQVLVSYDERRLEQEYYAQDTWMPAGSRATVTAGARIEASGLTGETLVSPRLAARVPAGERWVVRGAIGRYYQTPSFSQVFGFTGNEELRASRSWHYTLGVERRLADRTSASIEVYDREDRGLPFSLSEPRLEHGRPTTALEPFENALDGYGRGVEFVLQRRSANGMTGWMSYAWSTATLTDAAHGLRFPADADQRHTVNAFASYRVSHSLAVTGVWRFGTGTPITGFLGDTNGTIGLSADRNQLRAPVYSRVDARVARDLRVGRAKLTLSGEVLNLLNRQNEYNVQSTLFRVAETGRFASGLRRSFPLLPSVGVAIEF